MTEKPHKIVNGEKVFLSDQEIRRLEEDQSLYKVERKKSQAEERALIELSNRLVKKISYACNLKPDEAKLLNQIIGK